jgi:hypothetical protein
MVRWVPSAANRSGAWATVVGGRSGFRAGGQRPAMGPDRCVPDAAIERHFADVFSGAMRAIGDFLAGHIRAKNLHLARPDDDEHIRALAFIDDDALAQIGSHATARCDRLEYFVMEHIGCNRFAAH